MNAVGNQFSLKRAASKKQILLKIFPDLSLTSLRRAVVVLSVEVGNRMQSIKPILSSVARVNAGALLLLSAVVVVCLATSCATNTGEKINVSRAALSSVQRLGVAASAETQFQVRYSRDEAGSSGAMVGGIPFGVVGAIVGNSIQDATKASADSSKTMSLARSLAEFNGPKYLQQEVVRRLVSAGMFPTVTPLDTNLVYDATAADAALVLNLRTWGLRRQQGGGTNDLLQIGFDVNVRLVRPNGKVMWERDDLLLDGEATSLSQFKDTPDLLVERLTAALDIYAGRVVNELRYSE